MEWDHGLSLGVERMDVEHRQIVRRVRQIAAAVAEGRPEEILGTLRFLGPYLVQHFQHEEAWMAEVGYPGAGEHARIHAVMLEAVTDAREQASGEAGDLGRAAADLAAALDEHMRSEDLKLGRFFTARENLRLLAEAGPGVGVALTPLPGSLAAVRPARLEPEEPPYPAAAAVSPRTMK